jgi:transposase InsO family protein
MPFASWPYAPGLIDGGSEFKAEFEEACEALALPPFVLPPHSPKLNGRVERSHRTHEEEFYHCYEGGLTLAELRPALRAWETVYNTVRPHQALAYATPWSWLQHPPETEHERQPNSRLPLPKADSTSTNSHHV